MFEKKQNQIENRAMVNDGLNQVFIDTLFVMIVKMGLIMFRWLLKLDSSVGNRRQS